MFAVPKRLRYKPLPGDPYLAIAAYAGERQVARVDWCRGEFYLVIKGVGLVGRYPSKSAAKSALRYYRRSTKPVVSGVCGRERA